MNDGDVWDRVLNGCSEAYFDDPYGNPCEQRYGQQLVDDADTMTYPVMTRSLDAIRRKAPKARIAVLGYPHLVPEVGTKECTDQIELATGDMAYLNKVEKSFNGALKRAASDAGATYVDVYAPSNGRDMCAPADVRWLEDFEPVNAWPMHPNARAHEAYAALTVKALEDD